MRLILMAFYTTLAARRDTTTRHNEFALTITRDRFRSEKEHQLYKLDHRQKTEAELTTILQSTLAQVHRTIMEEAKAKEPLSRRRRGTVEQRHQLCPLKSTVMSWKHFIEDWICPVLNRQLRERKFGCEGRHDPCLRCTSDEMLSECQAPTQVLPVHRVCTSHGIGQMCSERRTVIDDITGIKTQKVTGVKGLDGEQGKCRADKLWRKGEDRKEKRNKCCKKVYKKSQNWLAEHGKAIGITNSLACIGTHSIPRKLKIRGELSRCRTDECFAAGKHVEREHVMIDFPITQITGCCGMVMNFPFG